MDTGLFLNMLKIDSTSGKEAEFAAFLQKALKTPGNTVERFESPDAINLLLSWGSPKFFFCTHMDTVPPYIPPTVEGDIVKGRGACDAKGQIFSMFEACKELEKQGYTDFALLLLSGEETGSFGAKAWTRDCPGGDIVVVGEPTDGKMVTASKGTKSFAVRIPGKACHSGYPELGTSAVELFTDFCNCLRATKFPVDPELGETTWNIGRLTSDNPQNILSPEVTFRIYFRTTFASDDFVQEFMASQLGMEVTAFGGDTPMHYFTVDGIPQTTVSFGSDAPRLERFARKALCGPGSIRFAHTPDEQISLDDVQKAINQYITIFKCCAGY